MNRPLRPRMPWPPARAIALVAVIACVTLVWALGRSAFGVGAIIRGVAFADLLSFGADEARFLTALVTVQLVVVVAALGLVPARAVARARAALGEALKHPGGAYVALALLGVALTLGLALFATELHTSTEDEKTYLFQSQLLRLGRLSIPVPPEGDPFAGAFIVINAGRWSGQYFWAQPAFLAIATVLGTPWIVSIVEVALTIWFSGQAAARFSRDARVGFLTAALVATSPLVVMNASTLLNVNLAATCVAMSLWAISVLREERSVVASCVLGLSTGVAVHNRPLDHLAVLAPVAVALLLEQTRTTKQTIARFLPSILVAAPFLALYPVVNHAVTGDAWQNGYMAYNGRQGWSTMGFGVGPGGHGQTLATAAAKTISSFARVAVYTTGCPILLATAAIAYLVPPSPTSGVRACALAIVGAFFGAYFFYVSAPILIAGPVYYVAVAPVVCGWTAASLLALHDHVRARPEGGALLPWLVVVTTVVAVVTAWPPMVGEIHRGATLSLAAQVSRVAEAHDLHRALVFVPITPPQPDTFESRLPFPSPRFDDDVLYVHSFDPETNLAVARRFGAGRSFYFVEPDLTTIRRFDPATGALRPLADSPP